LDCTYGYITIIDFELDRLGYLTKRASLSASALLGWGVGTITAITSNTRFESVFIHNVQKALAAQYNDVQWRSRSDFDRAAINIDKNRAVVAAVAGFCAAAKEPDDRLIRVSELLLEPFQTLDDLQDLHEDINANNLTAFSKIVREFVEKTSTVDNDNILYSIVLFDYRAASALKSAVKTIAEALLLLDQKRDHALISYFSELRCQILHLLDIIEDCQTGRRTITEPELVERVRTIVCNS
jgi:hypothetical protein